MDNGLKVDLPALDEYRKALTKDIKELENKIITLYLESKKDKETAEKVKDQTALLSHLNTLSNIRRVLLIVEGRIDIERRR